jgi:LysM repeat protein
VIKLDENNTYFTYYTIEKGDNLYEISKKYNINPKLLAAINGIKDNEYIYPGQELIIPKSGYSYYITAEGDTLSGVTEAFRTSTDNMLRYNKTIYLLPDQILVYKNQSL